MSSPEQFRTVTVRLHFPPGAKIAPGALLHLRVEDVSAADRRTEAIAEQVRPLVSDLTTQIDVPAGLIDGRSSYSVFVHVDANGSGKIQAGDFIAPQVHPVLTHGAPDAVEVRLVEVGGH